MYFQRFDHWFPENNNPWCPFLENFRISHYHLSCDTVQLGYLQINQLFKLLKILKIGVWRWNFFGVKEYFFMNFDLKNSCKNEFEYNNEKSCSWSRNRVSHKIDLKAVWPRNGHADSVGVTVVSFSYRGSPSWKRPEDFLSVSKSYVVGLLLRPTQVWTYTGQSSGANQSL